MRTNTPILALLICLTVLMALPSVITLPRVYGVNQSGATRWSPFGPQQQNLIINVYDDFTGMFTAFTTGQLDVTDWPVQPANLGTGSASKYCDNTFNPDYFCTTPTNEFGIFDLQINSFVSPEGKPLTAARAVSPASASTGANTAACSTGFGSLKITLVNQETGLTIKDSFNTVTATNEPSGAPSSTQSDSGGATPNGVYNIPCILAGATYQLSTSIYSGTATVPITSGANTPVTFNVNFNSISNTKLTDNRYYWGAGIGHLVEVSAWVGGFFGAGASAAAKADNTFDPGIITPVVTGTELTQADCFVQGNTANPVLHSWSTQCGSFPSGGLESFRYNMASCNGLPESPGGGRWWEVTGPYVPTGGYACHDDIRAACDDFSAMGIALVNAPNGCADVANALANSTLTGTPWTATSYPHLVPTAGIEAWARTSAARKDFGTVLFDSLNAIFGSPMGPNGNAGNVVCWSVQPCGAFLGTTYPEKYVGITVVAPIIFGDGPTGAGGSGPNGWQLYTGGFTLTSTPDFLWALFNSEFSGGNGPGTAGGCFTPSATTPPPASEPGNYVFFCNPQFDTDSSAGEFSTGGASTNALFRRAAIDGLNSAMDQPFYTGIDTFVELNGWNFQQCTGSPCVNTQSSLVNTVGAGTENPFWTLLNARQVPGYVPSSSSNTPGAGNPNLVRYGFSQGTDNLSPFQYTTVWDANAVFEVYDSMLATNPLVPASAGQIIDWQTTTHGSAFSPTASCSSPGTGPVTGCTTQVWHLRNDLKFQDGNSVTANDVAYSILSFRDVPSANLGSSVANVVSAQGTDCGTGQPCKTLQVVLALQSPFYELDIGGLPILEQALWQPYCGAVTGSGGLAGNGIPTASSSVCAGLAFDPMTATNPLNGVPGIFVGDGPFSCIVPTGFTNAGHVGGPCTKTGGGALGTMVTAGGSTFLLTRNSLYFRCCSSGSGATGTSLYKFSYSDGAPGSAIDGLDNISDLAAVAACFGLSSGASNAICTSAQSSYWVNSNIAPGSTVNISDLATVAFYFGAGVTSNGGASVLASLTGIDPQVNPFFCPTTGC